MPLSRRARMMRSIVDTFVVEHDRPLDERRAAMERADRLPRPRNVTYDELTLGGVPALRSTPTASAPERHVLYLHGGGYIMGSPRSHVALCARLAKRSAATVTAIDYRLAPEHPYPAAIDDCVAAYRALVEHTDPATVVIAGDSAGGGATLATLCRLRDEGTAVPAAGYLISPWTDLTASGDSIATKADVDPMIDPGMLVATAALYAGAVPLGDPGVSPLFADLAGLPPLLVQVGSEEVLLDDSTRLVERARSAGVDVDLHVAEGLWHVYQGFAGLMPEATDALVDAATWIRQRTPASMSLAG